MKRKYITATTRVDAFRCGQCKELRPTFTAAEQCCRCVKCRAKFPKFDSYSDRCGYCGHGYRIREARADLRRAEKRVAHARTYLKELLATPRPPRGSKP